MLLVKWIVLPIRTVGTNYQLMTSHSISTYFVSQELFHTVNNTDLSNYISMLPTTSIYYCSGVVVVW